MFRSTTMTSKALLLVLLGVLYGCAATPVTDDTAHTGVEANVWTLAPVRAGNAPDAQTRWQHYLLPGKQATSFRFARNDGRDAMAVQASASASMLRQMVHIAPSELSQLKFSWKVPELIAQADMAVREMDDSPVRIVLAFDGDRSKFSAKNAMLSELSHALTGEPMPYATLMYVWCNTRVAGSVITNPRTDRIRKLVVESGGGNLNRWLDYERDVRADFEKAFGEAPGNLVGVGIMTDTDNTQSDIRAWYGTLTLAKVQ
jgi:hypothetical protein